MDRRQDPDGSEAHPGETYPRPALGRANARNSRLGSRRPRAAKQIVEPGAGPRPGTVFATDMVNQVCA
eukprot:5303141-Pyramimonas_sp.AAC.1